MKSTISSKGQVTVPVAVRTQLGLTPGTVVEFEMAQGKAILRKGAGRVHPIDKLYGLLNLKRRTDDLIDDLRGPRPRKP